MPLDLKSIYCLFLDKEFSHPYIRNGLERNQMINECLVLRTFLPFKCNKNKNIFQLTVPVSILYVTLNSLHFLILQEKKVQLIV